MLNDVVPIIGDLVVTDKGCDEVLGLHSDGRPIMKRSGLSATFRMDVIGHVCSDIKCMAESDLPTYDEDKRFIGLS